MEKKKKILIISTLATHGGVQTFVRDLAGELQRQGHGVSCAFGDGDFLPKELEKKNIPWHRFKFLRRSHRLLLNLLFLGEFTGLLWRRRPDAVHLNSSNALMAALPCWLVLRKPKVVFTVHGLSLLDENYGQLSWLKKFYLYYFKLLLYFVDQTVYVSRHNLESAEKLGLAKDAAVVHNGINPEAAPALDREAARAGLESELPGLKDFVWQKSLLLGSIGRLSYQKNYEFLIDVFPEVLRLNPEAKLMIVGSGPKENEYRAKIKKARLENNIILTGSLDNASRFLRAFDLFVLPSRYEGLAITLIEALFAGRPILTTRVGGSPEILNNSKEQLYGLNDKEEFLAKLKALMEDNDLREKLSEQNQALAEKFRADKMAGEYLEFYK